MKTLVAGIAALLLLSPTGYAEDWVTYGRFAAAPVSCADWLKDRKSVDPERWDRDVFWMFGFLTALVRAKGPIEGGGMTAEDFPGEIDELCAAHPTSSAPAILEIFAVRHKLIAPEHAETSN
jgi:hypothetical protein